MLLGPTPLEEVGIEEIEPSVCEDTFENKRILRANSFFWETVKNEDNSPTGLIRCFSKEQLTERRDSTWVKRKPIMVDPDDRYSEYVGPDEYPVDFDMPFWIRMRKQEWVDVQLGRLNATPGRTNFPVRCEVVRHDGTRCWNWAPRPDRSKRCKQHVAWADTSEQYNQHIARIKIAEAAPAMADNLLELAVSAAGEAVRLKATTDALAIAGIRGGTELDMTVRADDETDPAQKIRERLAKLTAAQVAREAEEAETKKELEASSGSSSDGDIVEGVIVEETEAGKIRAINPDHPKDH